MLLKLCRPVVDAFGGFIALVYLVEGKSYKGAVYYGDRGREGVSVRADLISDEAAPAVF